MNKIINYNILDESKVLYLSFEKLDISLLELNIINLIIYLKKDLILVTPELLAKKLKIDEKIVHNSLSNLINRNYLKVEIENNNIIYNYDHLLSVALKMILKEKNDDIDIISIFEKEFGRPLTPIELDSIREWVGKYGIEKLKYALKESVLASACNLRYIEKILINKSNF